MIFLSSYLVNNSLQFEGSLQDDALIVWQHKPSTASPNVYAAMLR